MLDLSLLNSAQQAAVTAPDGPLLIIAGAGSGKTRTLVYRLAWLAEQGVNPQSILLLTFTRKASKEMLSRASQLLGTNMGIVRGGTFHSFAFSVLAKYRPVWAKGALTLIDGTDAVTAIKVCREELNIGEKNFPKPESILALLSKARNKEISIKDIVSRDSPHLLGYTDSIQNLAVAYQAYRRKHNMLDYDDLLFDLEVMLKDPKSGLASSLQRQYQYIMVDEYQDTNKVQARLARMLTGEHHNLMVVGDDAQSIYAFRGADIHNILDFPNIFPETTIIKLAENYRSTPPILDVANAILAATQENIKKNLYTTQKITHPRPVKIIFAQSNLTQAVLVAETIERLLHQYKPQEIAILFRAGFHSYALETELNKRKIAFVKYGGLRYAEAAHVKDILSYIRLILNPMDIMSFQRLALYAKGVGIKTIKKLYQSALEKGNFLDACTKYPELLEEMTFIEKQRHSPSTPASLIAEILKHYQPKLESLYPDDWPRRKQGLEELGNIASAYTDVETMLADLSLETPEYPQEENDKVVLSTVHSAKGLEWKAVIILDLVEDRFPSTHAKVHSEDFEEERRLMYVACTRAKEYLDLCVPSTIFTNYGITPTIPSSFVRNLPAEIWEEKTLGKLTKCENSPFVFKMGKIIDKKSHRDTSNFVPSQASPALKTEQSKCWHKIFGLGTILKEGENSYTISFPGLGIKKIQKDFVKKE